MLDKVKGAAHFDIDRQKAIELHRALSATLPGYLVPRLVYEEAGREAKSAVYT
jgi:L-lysine 2,3-aminomutase